MKNKENNKMAAVICLILTAGVFALAGVLLYFNIEPSQAVSDIKGVLLTLWTGSIVYWTGSSKNSSDNKKGDKDV